MSALRKEKKKICIDARLIDASGIGRYLKGIIKALKSSPNFELVYLCHQEQKQYFENAILMKSGIYSLSEQWELALKIPPCALFFSPHFNIPILPIKAQKRVTTICDAYHLDHLNHLSLPQKIYASFFYNAALSFADHMITISDFSKERLLKKCRRVPKQLSVIYPGVDIKCFEEAPSKEAIEKLRNKYSLPGRFFLTVGNHKPHKNLRRLLLAYQLFLKEEKNPPALVLCGKKGGFIHGEHSLNEILEEDKNLKKHVLFTGIVEEEELPLFYHLATLFVFPSLYEGFGYPPLEAMAANCPVIASHAASIPEVCGDAPFYVDPYDIQEMCEALKKVYLNISLQEELKRKGRQRVAQFDLDKSLRAHLNVIEKVLS